jgi:hypothetical protein
MEGVSQLRKIIIGTLMLVCSFGTAANAASYRLPDATINYHQNIISNLRDNGRWRQERRRQDEERRRRAEDRRRQEEQRRRDEENRRRDEENRRRDEENRRRDEENRRHKVPPPHSLRDRIEAKRVIRATADYLIRAQQAARKGRYYFGLGKAYAHQEEAQKLYRGGHYKSAMAHSLRARQIARDVIEANRPGRPRRYGLSPQYNDEIDNQLSIKIRDDKAVLSLKINL